MLRPAKHLADTRNTWTAGRQQDDCDGRMTAITKRVCCTMFAASRVTQESHRRWTRNQLKKPTRSLTFEWLVLNSINLSTEYTRKLLLIVSHDHHRLVNDVCQTLSLKVYSLESKLWMHSHSQVQIHQLTSTDSLWHNRRKKRLTLLLPSLQNLFLSKNFLNHRQLANRSLFSLFSWLFSLASENVCDTSNSTVTVGLKAVPLLQQQPGILKESSWTGFRSSPFVYSGIVESKRF